MASEVAPPGFTPEQRRNGDHGASGPECALCRRDVPCSCSLASEGDEPWTVQRLVTFGGDVVVFEGRE